MIQQKILLIIALSVTLLAGCANPYAARAIDDADEYVIPAVAEPVDSPEGVLDVAEPAGVLTLADVLRLTLLQNPELSVYSLGIRIAQARQLQAGLGPNPDLEIEVEEAGGTGDRSGFDAAETTIRLSQLIERGNKAEKRRRVAAFDKELAGIDYEVNKGEIFSRAAKAFIAVLAAQQQLALSNELLTLAEESFETVAKRVRAGRDSPTEQTRASVALAEIRLVNRKARRNLEFARKTLAAFWGCQTPVFEQAAGNLDDIEPLPPLAQLTERLQSNPAYTRWQTEIRKSRAVVDLEKANAIGDITVGAGMQRFNETDDNAIVFGISIPLPVNNRNQGSRQRALYELAQSAQQQKAEQLKLQEELNQAYHDYGDAYEQAVSLKEEILPGAENMFRAATTAYREGKVDYLHVLDAQRTLFEAKEQYLAALSACRRATTDLDRLAPGADNVTEPAVTFMKGDNL